MQKKKKLLQLQPRILHIPPKPQRACGLPEKEREVGGMGREKEKERKKVAASFTLLSAIVGGQNKQGDDIIKPETERFLKAFVCRVNAARWSRIPNHPAHPSSTIYTAGQL